MKTLREFRAVPAALLLMAACLLATPALAGPQNGEVNHARTDVNSVSVEGPTIEVSGPLAFFRDLLMLIPLDWLVPSWEEHANQ